MYGKFSCALPGMQEPRPTPSPRKDIADESEDAFRLSKKLFLSLFSKAFSRKGSMVEQSGRRTILPEHEKANAPPSGGVC